MKNLPANLKTKIEKLVRYFLKNINDDQHGCFTIYEYISVNKKQYQITFGIHEYTKEIKKLQGRIK